MFAVCHVTKRTGATDGGGGGGGGGGVFQELPPAALLIAKARRFLSKLRKSVTSSGYFLHVQASGVGAN